MTDLGRLRPQRRSGNESLRVGEVAAGFDLLDFWRWSGSDLVTNTTRGRLAEYIVARGLGIATNGVRDEWAAFDLTTPEGTKVEVKSGSYLQSWHQNSLSSITFSIKKSRAWNAETNEFAAEQRRQADVYAFALLAHKHKPTLDPLNIDQWEFYVLPTQALNSRRRSQHSITLASLQRLNAGPFKYAELRKAIAAAADAAVRGEGGGPRAGESQGGGEGDGVLPMTPVA